MKKVTILGAQGFIGKNLIEGLNRSKDYEIQAFDINDDASLLGRYLENSDIVFHLAGINRPKDEKEFETGNTGLTNKIVSILERAKCFPPVIFSSSTQAELQNPYGISKKNAEDILIGYSKRNNAKVFIYRFTNVFGKWCRPNYNSAVATFCSNIAQNLDITIADVNTELRLIYIDDIVNEFLSLLNNANFSTKQYYHEAGPIYSIKLGQLADTIKGFHAIRKTLIIPDFSDKLTKKLYATYLSYLKKDDFAYNLELKNDQRGSLFEFIKSRSFGQLFVSRSYKGVIRGNHYHNSKIEKFCVVEGEALIKFKNILTNEVLSYPVSGKEIKVVDIPPGYTHSIENTGDSEIVVLFWANEIYDPAKPDTYFLEV